MWAFAQNHTTENARTPRTGPRARGVRDRRRGRDNDAGYASDRCPQSNLAPGPRVTVYARPLLPRAVAWHVHRSLPSNFCTEERRDSRPGKSAALWNARVRQCLIKRTPSAVVRSAASPAASRSMGYPESGTP